MAGLEAAEEVFVTLDPQQQLEAFASDGEEVEAGKVIARTSGFADVLLAGERVALNLLQHLSGVATVTRQFVRAIEGTNAKIADTRKTTPGLRHAGEVRGAARRRSESSLRAGRRRLHQGESCRDRRRAGRRGEEARAKKSATFTGSQLRLPTKLKRPKRSKTARMFWSSMVWTRPNWRIWSVMSEPYRHRYAIEASGLITLENVRAYADAGADLIRVDALTQSVKAMAIGFQIQPG